jgi:prepilin-type N-terminal cleavage/methylation domain-containing protein
MARRCLPVLADRLRGCRARCRGRARDAGFTLIELVVVMGVLSVLFGIAVGFLGRTDPQQVADSVLRGELRAAQLTARAEGLPTEVLVTPGRDGASATVQSRLLQPVVVFHCEPDERVLDELLRGLYGGDDEPQGRFGHARQPKAGDTAPLVRWPVPQPLVELGEGFALRLDLRLDERRGGTVARLGSCLELLLDGDGRPHARLRLSGGTAGAANLAALRSPLQVPLQRWVTLEVGCDGQHAWLAMDGRSLDRAVADGRPQLPGDAVFDVMPGDAPVPAAVDEVRLYAYTMAPAQTLPNVLQPERAYRLRFDARGEAIGNHDVALRLPQERP